MVIGLPGLLLFMAYLAAGLKKPLSLLTIYHQNDIHAHYGTVDSSQDVCRKDHPDGADCYGGFARAVAFIKWNKQNNHSLLNLNAGDFFQGHVYHTIFGWKIAADMASKMPYDALALGDQEFHDGLDSLVRFMRAVGSVFVCTNLDFSRLNASLQEELRELCPRHRLVAVGVRFSDKPVQVALLGYTTPETALRGRSGDIQFEDEVEALTREVRLLRAAHDTRVFVALGHSGLERDKEVAYQVPSLDIIVGSHSHTLLWPGAWQPFLPDTPEDPTDHAQGVYPVVVTQESGRTVLVVQALRHGKYMGAIDVGLNDDGEVRKWTPRIFLLEPFMDSDQTVARLLKEYDKKMDNKRSQVIGQSLVELQGANEVCYQSECNLGNMFADAILWANKRHDLQNSRDVNIALVNSGAIANGSFPAGNITLDMLLKALPYQDTITTVSMTGETLLEALEHSVSEQRSGRFLQVSGVKVKYNIGLPVHHRVVSAQVLCTNCSVLRFSPVQPSLTYDVAMLTYMADGADSYDMVRDGAKSRQSKNMQQVDIMLQYMQAFSKAYPQVEGRITIVDEPDETSGAGQPLPSVLVLIVCAVLMTFKLGDGVCQSVY